MDTNCQNAKDKHWKAGKWSRGKPRKNWKVYVQEDATNFTDVNNIDNETVEVLVNDRV